MTVWKCSSVFLRSGGESEHCELNNTFSVRPHFLLLFHLNLLHFVFIFITCRKKFNASFLTCSVTHKQLLKCLHTHQVGCCCLGRKMKAVIAACRWRACGFCWLWRLLYVRGWMKRRICAQLWFCCLETLLLSRSHKLAWLQLDWDLHSPDRSLLQPLALKREYKEILTKVLLVSFKYQHNVRSNNYV